MSGYQNQKPSTQMADDGTDCFIATVVFGNPYAPQVVALRRFRDTALTNNPAGSLLRMAYYSGLGKAAAKAIEHIPGAVPLIRTGLGELVKFYERQNPRK